MAASLDSEDAKKATERRGRLQTFHTLTELIEHEGVDELAWNPAVSDKDLLAEELLQRQP